MMDKSEFDEEAWEARKAELRQQYHGIAGEYKAFRVLVITEHGCNPREGEFSVHVSGIINGWVSKDDVDMIFQATWEEIGTLNLPDEGTTELIAYESGEREDVFWSKFFKLSATPAHPAAQTEEE